MSGVGYTAIGSHELTDIVHENGYIVSYHRKFNDSES